VVTSDFEDGRARSFGFPGSWRTTDSTPSAFSLDGVACGPVS
jgi:hypothetical protein